MLSGFKLNSMNSRKKRNTEKIEDARAYGIDNGERIELITQKTKKKVVYAHRVTGGMVIIVSSAAT